MQQQKYTDYQIVIVDDGSNHLTKEYLSQLQNTPIGKRLKVISQINQGRAKARNVGAQNAIGERLVFIDDDIVVVPDFLARHAIGNDVGVHGKILTLSYLKFFEDPSKGQFYKEFACEARRTDILRRKCICLEDICTAFDDRIAVNGKLSRSEWLIQYVFDNQIKPLQWLGATGGNFSVAKKWFDEVGGFDEAFGKMWGYEDFDLGYRLMQKGYRFIYDHDAIGYHIAHYRDSNDACNENAHLYIDKCFSDLSVSHVIDYLCGRISKKEIAALILPVNDLLTKVKP